MAHHRNDRKPKKTPDQRRSGVAASCHSEKTTILLQAQVAYPEPPQRARPPEIRPLSVH